MGGVGLVSDQIILGIARAARRAWRRNAALKWPLTEGKITRFQAEDDGWNEFRPVVDYSYEVGGEAWRGILYGLLENRRFVDQVGNAVDGMGTLRVRYDPADAYRSRVLNEDNPRLPFLVDLNKGM